jgi:hypothetical protein
MEKLIFEKRKLIIYIIYKNIEIGTISSYGRIEYKLITNDILKNRIRKFKKQIF